ncbi:MAG: hypothetical protein ACFB01_08270 [Cohaesibacteraceae bacterium]
MKTLALTAVAATVALGSFAAPAFAADQSNDIKVDTQIVSISGDTAFLANGTSVDAPRAAASGDKVRVIFNENNDLKRVLVLR